MAITEVRHRQVNGHTETRERERERERNCAHKHIPRRAVVVVQLVERSLPTPKACGSDPVIGNSFILLINCQLH